MTYSRVPFLLIGAALTLGACSETVQDRLSDDWAPVYAPPQIETTRQMPTGAIYSETAPGLFAADRRAAQVGDILTVDFTERFSARDVQSASTSRSDGSSFNLPDALTGGFAESGLDMGSERSFSGSGSTTQSNSLIGRVSVTVMRVLPGGNLEVQGQRRLTLTSGVEYVRLRGVVRPSDISPDNVVRSDRLAHAEIEYVGAGTVSDATREGWLRRAVTAVSPL
ncbi:MULTISPECIES: flagellar basal body L-ring protein FlgH [Roseicyclus]|jgi:flagellar L-ring protein precursor FlgH|uniref:flagellar basal body L-ring protein FlgH n=1 Tax=Roseicyclus amphidinii TaxID=3034232 RepID=UPI0024E17631|nr:flagellar basal body L-ring protein FlgH [Roseicyclus sp. Amp-Y-6]